MEQKSIDWLIDKLTETQFLWLSDKPKMNELINIVNQAKEMEKQQQDESAIEFSKWCLDIGIYNQFKKTQGINKELLEIYKKEKGL
jgi:hypothetical protein